jgi:hypothetical protein
VGGLAAIAAAHATSYTLLLATALDPVVPLGAHRDRDLDHRARVDRHLQQNCLNSDEPTDPTVDYCRDRGIPYVAYRPLRPRAQ